MDVEKLKDQLILHEGLELKSYQCSAGYLTIGVGRNVEELGITEDEARYLLDNDILRVTKELDSAMPWWRNLSEVRQRVVVDMVFNLGLSRFLNFKNAINAMQEEDWDEAAAQMLDSRWADQVGQRAHRLAKAMVEDELEV